MTEGEKLEGKNGGDYSSAADQIKRRKVPQASCSRPEKISRLVAPSASRPPCPVASNNNDNNDNNATGGAHTACPASEDLPCGIAVLLLLFSGIHAWSVNTKIMKCVAPRKEGSPTVACFRITPMGVAFQPVPYPTRSRQSLPPAGRSTEPRSIHLIMLPGGPATEVGSSSHPSRKHR